MSSSPFSKAAPALPLAAQISRRELLQIAALLALPSTGCAPLARNVRLAVVASEGLSAPERAKLLNALIQAVLAYDHPDFALGTQAAVAQQLLHYFPIDSDPQFEPLVTALAIFERMDLFGSIPPPMRTAERKLLLAEGRADSDTGSIVAHAEAEDLRAYDALLRTGLGKRFSEADLKSARAYLSLWGRSAFLMRRRIYRALRSMILVAAYSLPAHWPAIGYDGPILDQSGSRGS